MKPKVCFGKTYEMDELMVKFLKIKMLCLIMNAQKVAMLI